VREIERWYNELCATNGGGHHSDKMIERRQCACIASRKDDERKWHSCIIIRVIDRSEERKWIRCRQARYTMDEWMNDRSHHPHHHQCCMNSLEVDGWMDAHFLWSACSKWRRKKRKTKKSQWHVITIFMSPSGLFATFGLWFAVIPWNNSDGITTGGGCSLW